MKKKADKKIKKKEKKSKNENNRDSDFIPTWEDIQYVMNLANDSLKWLFTKILKYRNKMDHRFLNWGEAEAVCSSSVKRILKAVVFFYFSAGWVLNFCVYWCCSFSSSEGLMTKFSECLLGAEYRLSFPTKSDVIISDLVYLCLS